MIQIIVASEPKRKNVGAIMVQSQTSLTGQRLMNRPFTTVTRRVCKKINQKFAQTHFMSKFILKLIRGIK
jgi:hypothetical protein